MENTYTNFE